MSRISLLSRRSILKALAGAGASAPSVGRAVSTGSVGALSSLGAGAAESVPEPPTTDPEICGNLPLGWELASRIRRRQEHERNAMAGHLPPHIACMKSWSPAYKAHVYVQEEQALQALIDRIEEDDALASRISELLGLSLDG